MSTDFAALLYDRLPGLYRDKDDLGELRNFLQIVSDPLTEIDQSIAQLYQDFFINSSRDTFVALLGPLIGVPPAATQPPWAQRAEVSEAFAFYRSKGLQQPLPGMANHLTRLPVQVLDFSQQVARAPFLQDTDPVLAFRNQPVGEAPAGSGRFYFRTDLNLQPLYDFKTGRAITRTALMGQESEYAGVDGRFSIKQFQIDVFTRAANPYSAVAADLTDFTNPKTPSGTALALTATQIGVDPVLGRFLMPAPHPLAGNLTTDYEALVPASLARQTFDITDPGRMVQLGRTDDPAPYSLDLRAPRAPQDKFGRTHFDNHGFFFTFGKQLANQKPDLLASAPPAQFSFDNRPLPQGSTQGAFLQLLDGIDGSPLTRLKLQGHEADFCGTARGFSVRVNGLAVLDPAFQPSVKVRAADLSDFTHPKDAGGNAIVLAPTDIAVDPQLGRFTMNLAALAITAETVRVDYLLGPSRLVQRGTPDIPDTTVPQLFTFAANGGATLLRDGFDGTPVTVKLRLGAAVTDFHGTGRGWVICRNQVDISGALPAEIKSLANSATAVTQGKVAVDPDLGRFKFPAGFLQATDTVTVDFNAEDLSGEQQLLDSFAQRLPRMLPAGVVPVIVDTRRTPVNPAVLR
jgi:hypothetical protein